jgi:hypothetical protein
VKALVYALQSSGASLFTYFMGQRPGSIAVIDLRARAGRLPMRRSTPVAPFLESASPIVLKCVVTVEAPFERHVESFRPDCTILFLRDPHANAASLRGKAYERHGGGLEEKLQMLEGCFRSHESFDAVICYEDFVHDRAGTVDRLDELGWNASQGYYDFDRSLDEIVRYNCAESAWCARHRRTRWGTGNIRGDRVERGLVQRTLPPSCRERVERLCPDLCGYYAERASSA